MRGARQPASPTGQVDARATLVAGVVVTAVAVAVAVAVVVAMAVVVAVAVAGRGRQKQGKGGPPSRRRLADVTP